ncbi:hypothetical protein LDENG_00252320 [Lucifuga dentata]|nr:hypothetical protein LDENG_00252320 [Lucifuga dentata]
MKLYRCIITGDEMFSDVYKCKLSDDGVFYEVEGKNITRCEGDIDDSLIGGNASAEDPTDNQLDSTSVSGIDIALNHHLTETTYSKKQYIAHVKEYVKSLVSRIEKDDPERVAAFKKGANDAVKNIVSNLDSYRFFMGERWSGGREIIITWINICFTSGCCF